MNGEKAVNSECGIIIPDTAKARGKNSRGATGAFKKPDCTQA